MTRSTDTRAKVRAAADEIAARGGAPTPTMVLSMLESGSPNTVVDELRKWRLARAPSLPGGAESPTPDTPLQSRVTQLEFRTSTTLAQQARTLENLERGMATLLARLEGPNPLPAQNARDQSSTLTGDTAAAIKSLATQFDGMQRYMLLQINEAREETIRWRAKAVKTREEFDSWQTVMRQKYDTLATENTWLRGRLNEPLSKVAQALPVSSQSAGGVRPQLNYPGHPRAVVQHNEAE